MNVLTQRPPQSLESFVDDYRRALAMLAARGVQTANGRLLRYRRVLESALARELHDPDAAHAHQEGSEFINALLEASEMIAIAGLGDSFLVGHDVLTKFRELGCGPDQMDHSKDDPARNYAFEFATAAQAATNDHLVGFIAGDVEVGPPACSIECKRISSLKRLGDNLSDARDQLKAGGRAGIIAIDLATPIRHQKGLVVHSDSEAAQRQRVDQELTAYLGRHWGDHLGRVMNDPAVLGVAFRHVVVGSVGTQSQIRVARTWQSCLVHADDNPISAQFEGSLEWISDAPVVNGTLGEIDAAGLEIFGSDSQ